MTKSISHANRGMGLETLIEYTNAQYANKGIAQIQKIPTSWKIVRQAKRIATAFPEKKSTVDFMGVYGGRAIAFDAKSTENKTRFPFANVEQHQINFMKKWQNNGGIAFFIIEFTVHKETYLLTLDEFLEMREMSDRESIPYKYFQVMGTKVMSGAGGVLLDYLKHVGVTA